MLRLPRRALLVCLVALGPMGLVGAASSSNEATAKAPTDGHAAAEREAAESSLAALIGEIWLLGRLDAFAAPMPDQLAQIAGTPLAAWSDAPADRPDMMKSLIGWEAFGVVSLNQLESVRGAESPEALQRCLSPLSDADLALLGEGGTIDLTAQEYVAALRTLLDMLGVELDEVLERLAVAGEAGAVDSATDDSVTPEPPSRTARADPTGEESSGNDVRDIALAGVAVSFGLAAAGLLGVRRGRRRAEVVAARRNASIDEHVGRVGRLMAATLDAGRIADLAEQAAVRLTSADHARLAPLDDLDDLGRDAVASGATTSGSGCIAVPVVGNGSVIRVLTASGVDASAEHVLRKLASFIGPTLASAESYSGAVEVDPLTTVFNRRRLDRDLLAATSSAASTALVMVDIDHFKGWNDRHGHIVGDRVLRTVAETLRTSVRPGDVVYRYGGEEFAIILADTDEDEAADVAERVRAAVESATIVVDGRDLGQITASLGVAAGEASNPDELSRRADAALFEAKGRGRNLVVLSPPDI